MRGWARPLLSSAAVVSSIVLPGAVPTKVIEQIRARMAAGPFISGKLSAVGRAVSIKNNLLLSPEAHTAYEESVVGFLEDFRAA